MPNGAPKSLEILRSDAKEAYEMCYEKAKKWAQTYYWSKGSLIVFSALTSATAIAALPDLLHRVQPFCALLVNNHRIRRMAKAWSKIQGALFS